MKVHSLVNIPKMKVVAGTEADLPDEFAEKLLAKGRALTLEDAQKIDAAEQAKDKAAAHAAKAQADLEAKIEKAKTASKNPKAAKLGGKAKKSKA